MGAIWNDKDSFNIAVVTADFDNMQPFLDFLISIKPFIADVKLQRLERRPDMLRNQTWLDQTSTLGYNVAGTWNNLGYKNDPTTTTAAHVGNHRTRVIAGDAQAWPFKNTGLF